MSKIIRVIVLVLPDGTTQWFKSRFSKESAGADIREIKRRISEWKDENKELIEDSPGIDNAVCTIKMPESKFKERVGI